ncbi:MAG: hypothetical protein JWO46_1465 [Nocardioidaceae bacterium]|nr:hypothetical protein [Nocardioidaceae bacterium]
MYVATVIVSIVVALVMLGSGTAKFRRQPQIVEGLGGIGVPVSWFPLLGSVLYAGAIGLLVGLFWAPLGIAAGVGLVLYFLLAVGFHVKARDWAGIVAPTVLLVASAAALVLRSISA